MGYVLYSHVCLTVHKVFLVIGFNEQLQIVATSNYTAIAN
jgi:hypothetical protein